ncbi:gp436 family protein [Lonepinella sp. BR2271]|uniref:gp436 family protein n=1 Tax=Lonepinella sp. BR2271 TaxID=3434550 RepID=UPI003F6E3B40
MASYASAADFILRVGELQSLQLTDREGKGEINTLLLELALADSSSQMDGYLTARYGLPLAEIPQNLVRICCDLARFRLCSMSDVEITEEIIARYKLSLKELEQLASGKISLGLVPADDLDNSTAENAVQFFNGNNRVFGRDYEN